MGSGPKAWIKTCRVFQTRQVWNEHQRFRPITYKYYFQTLFDKGFPIKNDKYIEKYFALVHSDKSEQNGFLTGLTR
jgi:hypothetical protein